MTVMIHMEPTHIVAAARRVFWIFAATVTLAAAAFGQSNQQPPIDRDLAARRTLTTIWEPRVIRDIEYVEHDKYKANCQCSLYNSHNCACKS